MTDIDYQALEFAYLKHSDQTAPAPASHRVIVVGAGPVGLTTALDLAQRGVSVVVLDDDCKLSTGSRAICFAKRTLEIWDRLGIGERMTSKGVSWNVGKIFFRDQEVWRFDLLPEHGHRRPAFINLQQYYVEGFLYEAAAAHPLIDLRWKNKVVGVTQQAGGVDLSIETPDGSYELHGEWVVACDGARSPIRKLLGQESHGRVFKDRFLIADVKMHADFPAERWFWFDPPFHPNQSVLLHMQPDNVWRIDFQLGWNADPVEAIKPANVLPRIRALLGAEAQFELEWASVYTFACERMDAFRHGRIVFAGDAAHRVSPFGARGANSGVQDAENLAWKLQAVVAGIAPETLIDTYATEREHAADENLLNSTRSTDFITPKSAASRHFRNAVLNLAREHAFARGLVNSGRLSLPSTYVDSPLNTRDADVVEATGRVAPQNNASAFTGRMVPGAVALDAPVRDAQGNESWWLSYLDGRFVLALFCGAVTPDTATLEALRRLAHGTVPVRIVLISDGSAALTVPDDFTVVQDERACLRQRYDARPGTCYLVRPDQHIAARRREFDETVMTGALHRALGRV
ncbi:FAD-dependent oxidoreductase [Bordetella genomosp. 4]|uniref:FAD-dependent oxidoreductase n=1 Tax=Bordetella genomosp. 4 TaxID=463044 RepID=A0A261TLK9_9BORD|nr:FAD-dependent oxidoreductase [Bordetella genomosp. 4]OZI50534.1 FAD-dependent oxidoreductase [Bordetella genomosp. 4]